jgi:CheY-like chemotaxis protein
MGNMAHTGACPPAAGVAQGRAVLVVDNDANVRGLIETLLLRAGYQVLTASDATSAQRRIQSQPVDLVIMELSLPDTDGLAFLSRLKCDPATRALHVLIVSAYSDTWLKARCAALGACGFIGKPFHGRALVEAVDRILDGPR